VQFEYRKPCTKGRRAANILCFIIFQAVSIDSTVKATAIRNIAIIAVIRPKTKSIARVYCNAMQWQRNSSQHCKQKEQCHACGTIKYI
jgi:hypothetical protein